MMRTRTLRHSLPALSGALALAALTMSPGTSRAEEPADNARAVALGEAVVKASGGDQWANVKTVRFTFQAEQPGKTEPLLTAKHVWDVAGNQDTVTWGGKTVSIDLGAPNTEGDAKAAFARWTNDAYWLLAPLKLRDKGVHLVYGGERAMENGQRREVLDVSFDKVGLTNGDRYTWFIDPQTHLPTDWDYMPAPEKKIHATWKGYQETGGLTLATDHDFGDKRIRFLDVQVER